MTAVVLTVTWKSRGWVRRGLLLWRALPQDTGSTAEEEAGTFAGSPGAGRHAGVGGRRAAGWAQ